MEIPKIEVENTNKKLYRRAYAREAGFTIRIQGDGK